MRWSLLIAAWSCALAGDASAGVLEEAKALMDEIIVQPRELDESSSAIRYAAACDEILAEKEAIRVAFAAKPAVRKASTEIVAFCQNPLDPATTIHPIALVAAIASDTLRVKLTDDSVGQTVSTKESGAALGADWQNAVLRGIAAFLESRAEAELTAALLTEIKDSLCTEKGAGSKDALRFARRLLPSTCSLVDQAKDFYTHPVAWGVLRSAFKADLEAMPRSAFEILVEQLDETAAGRNMHDVLVGGLSLAVWSQRGRPTVETLAGMREHFRSSAIVGEAIAVDRPAAIATYLIGVTVDIVDPSLTKRPKVDQTRYAKIFTRFLWRALKADGLKLNGQDLALPSDAAAFLAKEAELAKIADRLIRVQIAFAAYHAALQSLGSDPFGAELKLARIEQRLKALVLAGSSVLREVSSSAQVILPILGLPVPAGLPEIQSKVRASTECAVRLFAAISAAANGDFGRVFVEVSAAYIAVVGAAPKGAVLEIPDPIKKYGPFIAEVAAVQTPEDMEKALENAAAPIGSWRTKRRPGDWTVALTGFVGVAGGQDYYVDEALDGLNGPHVGLMAPVGVDLAVGFGKGFGLQLFLSLIDVGSLLDVRIGKRSSSVTADRELINDANVPADQTPVKASVDAAPAYTFAQVLSPGLFVMLGVFDWPIVIGFGAAWKPELRAVDLLDADNQKVGEELNTDAIQVNGFVAVDVTLFPF